MLSGHAPAETLSQDLGYLVIPKRTMRTTMAQGRYRYYSGSLLGPVPMNTKRVAFTRALRIWDNESAK